MLRMPSLPRGRIARAIAAAGLGAVMLAGCSDGSGPGSTLSVAITSPGVGDRFLEGAGVQLSATAGPGDSIVWRSNIDGRLGEGGSVLASDLSLGDHTITATAYRDADRDSASVAIRIESLPDVSISKPASGSKFSPLEEIELAGQAVDRDGGTARLEWRSDRDGTLGTGSIVTVEGLSLGQHEIRLVAVDDEGQADSASVHLTVVDFALGFDGAQSGASAPDEADLDLSNNWTIEMWVRPFGVSGSQYLVSKWGADPPEQAWRVSLEGQSLRLVASDGADASTVTASGVVRDDVWRHLAIVFHDGDVELLRDGNVVATASSFIVPQDTDAPVSVGRFLHDDGTASAYFDGLIDEVRIWRVPRTLQQIRDNMDTRLSGGENGLVAYWRMAEGEGDEVEDGSSKGHALRLGDTVGPDAADPAWEFPGREVF